MSRKNSTVTLALSPEEKLLLEQIAKDFGCTWGKKPNISYLVRAISKGELKVVWGDEETPMTNHQRTAMKGAIALIQEGLSKLIKLI